MDNERLINTLEKIATPPEEFWVKTVDLLEQNWALINPKNNNTVTVYFIDDGSIIFDEIGFNTIEQAEKELTLNGFRKYLNGYGNFVEFIVPPEKPFKISKRPLYSSGEFWNHNKISRQGEGHPQIISNSNTIIGAVIGDVIGSVFEWNNIKTTDFDLFNPKCKFTDDTVLTVAVADCILNKKDFAKTIWEYGRKYRGRGYGGHFRNWLREDDLKPYGSFGNGSAMRASAVGFAFNDLETVMEMSKQSAEVTHNHPEGIKGAQAVATAIFLARKGKTKQEIRDYISKAFNYHLDFTLDEIRPTYKFDVSCQGSVPQAIAAFLESSDFESAIRLAISIGGDSDTIANIAGGIASAFYKRIPSEITDFVTSRLPQEYIGILNEFDRQYDEK